MFQIDHEESSGLILQRLREIEARFQTTGQDGQSPSQVFSELERSHVRDLRDHPDLRVKAYAAELALRMN